MHVELLVLQNITKDTRNAITPHLCLELKDQYGWLYYTHIFSEDRGFLKNVQTALRENIGKTIQELGNVECPGN